MIQKLMAIACVAPFVVRALWAFSQGDIKTGIVGVCFAIANLIIFW